MKKILLFLLALCVMAGCKKDVQTSTTEVKFTFNMEYSPDANFNIVLFEYDNSGNTVQTHTYNSCWYGRVEYFDTVPEAKRIKIYLSWRYRLKDYSAWVMDVYQIKGETLNITIDNKTITGETEP